jgi:hypothetical protein
VQFRGERNLNSASWTLSFATTMQIGLSIRLGDLRMVMIIVKAVLPKCIGRRGSGLWHPGLYRPDLYCKRFLLLNFVEGYCVYVVCVRISRADASTSVSQPQCSFFIASYLGLTTYSTLTLYDTQSSSMNTYKKLHEGFLRQRYYHKV